MPKRVDFIRKRQLFSKSIFRIEEVTCRFERYDGTMSEAIDRLNLDRGDSVAAILHDLRENSIVLVEQFRCSTQEKNGGWLLELPAGMLLEKDGGPDRTLEREVLEETGYQISTRELVTTFYPSPGGCSERTFLYYAAVSAEDRVGPGGGIREDGEDVRTVILPLPEAFRRLDEGEFADGKTIIGLHWLRVQRAT